jgi:hypothetical protein
MSYLKEFGRLAAALSLCLLIGMGCSTPGLGGTIFSGETGGPSAAISSPTGSRPLETGREIKVESVSIDPTGVVRVELVVNGQVVWIDANAKPETDAPFIVAQPWIPDTPGTHVIQVRAYNAANEVGESATLTVEAVALGAAGTAIATATIGQIEAVTLTPTSTTTSAVPNRTVSPTRTITPTQTRVVATPTLTRTPTVTPRPQVFSSTGLEPEGRFREIWLELGSLASRLGYPTGPEISDRNYARQFFEAGQMFWWDNPDDPDLIWVLDSPSPGFGSGATSNRYPDSWAGGDEYACDEARNGGPVRGFGKVWCEHPELQIRLGFPSEPERGSGGRPPYARVQFFQGGTMIYNPTNNEIYVLFAQGDWLRFEG